jgi:hypothetical protein
MSAWAFSTGEKVFLCVAMMIPCFAVVAAGVSLFLELRDK